MMLAVVQRLDAAVERRDLSLVLTTPMESTKDDLIPQRDIIHLFTKLLRLQNCKTQPRRL